DVYFATSNDTQTISKGINLSSNTGVSTDNSRLAVSGSNVYVIWQSFNTTSKHTDIFFKRSTDAGAAFRSLINLSNNTSTASGASVAASGNNVFVIWQSVNAITHKNDILFRSSTNFGATFGRI